MTTLPQARLRRAKDYLILSIKGFCMGASDVVPGVSGGTMALILGIYEELIHSVRTIDFAFFGRLSRLRIQEAMDGMAWPFLLAVGTGILTAVVTLSRGISWALTVYPVHIWSFFFGLVLASVWSVGAQLDHWKPTMVLWSVAAAIAAYCIVGLVPVDTPEAPWFIFVSGAVAICAMILPGISGSFILVLLGKYHYVLNAVNQRDLMTLLIFSAGAAAGLLSFVRLLNWLLERYRDLTMAALTGMMLGSLRKIWPWKVSGSGAYDVNRMPAQFDGEVIVALGLMVSGLIVVWAMNSMASRRH